ncbi:nose resistant to fluoxetine protein 6-like [Schistocerca gregaria]|uniref:nose resistant to fluoxetine protein 6-like n=1 Tax=Schistocerca gregaria TaxID=7010 RepID=UPI00211ECA58|nr:nose resistant to fluoxetine protein 6-like [Schistocerca gregaria]
MATVWSLALLLAVAAAEPLGPAPPSGRRLPAPAEVEVEDLPPQLRPLLPRAPEVGDACRRDTALLAEAARNRSTWALSMVDASNRRLAPGVLSGNTDLLGAYDQCVQARGPAFKSRYCLATVHLSGGAAAGRRLRWGTCVSATCSASDVAAQLTVALPAALGQHASVHISPDDCATADGMPLEPADWCFVALMVMFGVALVGSTVFDVFFSEKIDIKKDSAWLAFSVRKNWRSLTHVSNSGLTSVHGIKFLSMAWVVLFHKYAVMAETPIINSDIVEDGLKYDWTQMPVSNGGSLAVNTFFVVSGMLLSFVFLRDRSQGRPFGLVNFYVYRYVRLTPVYAVVIWLYATLSRHLGSGPLWSGLMAEHTRRCRASWWRNLLYINNYQSPGDVCVVQSWYLSADTQLYWLSPLVLYPMFRWPRVARGLLGGLLLVPIIVAFCLTYVLKFPWADVRSLEDSVRDAFFPGVYAATYTRASPFLVGLGLGWLLFHTKGHKTHLSVATVCVCWVASTACALAVVYSLHAYYVKPYNPLEAAFFSALHPLAWALVVSWIIFACERGYAGPVRRLLSWWGFQPLAKLCYSAYLIHFLVFYYELGTLRAPISYDHYSVVHIALGDVAIVLTLSTVFTLTFELPVLNLDKAWLKPDSKPSPAKPASPGTATPPASVLSSIQPPSTLGQAAGKPQDNPAFENTEAATVAASEATETHPAPPCDGRLTEVRVDASSTPASC